MDRGGWIAALVHRLPAPTPSPAQSDDHGTSPVAPGPGTLEEAWGLEQAGDGVVRWGHSPQARSVGLESEREALDRPALERRAQGAYCALCTKFVQDHTQAV